MDKVILKRGAIMVGLVIIILGISYACSLILDREVSPALSDPDGVFVETGDLSVTNQAWYDAAKSADGITQLLNMIDESILEDYLDAVSQDEIDTTILELTYGTSDLDEINELSDLEFERANQEYADLVLVSGFDPEDPSSVERFIRLSLAKEALVKERLRESIVASDDALDERVEDYYLEQSKGTLEAIVLRFRNTDEMAATLDRLGIVLDYEDGWGLYTGETPVEDIPSDGFNEDNTRSLADTEVLTLFLSLYDYLYPYKEALPLSATRSELSALDTDDLTYNYEDLIDGANDVFQILLNYMFESLRTSGTFYSKSSLSVGTERVLVYIIEDTPADLYSDLDSSERLELEKAYLDSLLTSETINREMADYRSDLGLEIHDSLLASQYQSVVNVDVFNAVNDTALIASINGEGLFVDDYFSYMARRIGALYAIDLIRDDVLLQSDYFENLYGSNRDLFANNNEALVTFRDQIRQDKLAFSNGVYAQFGFTPDRFTWEEFLQAGYGLDSEYDYLLTLALTDVRTAYINDRLDVTESLPYVQENHDYYMSLDVEQLLLFVDMDNDFTPDDFDAYYSGLNEVARSLVDQKVARFETVVEDALDSGQTMQDILDSFNAGLRGENEDDADYSEFAALKNEGFYLLYENLSPDNPEEDTTITFNSARNYVKPFLDGLVDFYSYYQSPENQNVDQLLNDQLIRTQFGIHILQGEPGPDFDRPSVIPTEANILAYQAFIQDNPELGEAEIEAGLRVTLGNEVYDGIMAYYAPVNSAFYSSNYFNALMIEDILGRTTFTTDDNYHSTILDTLGQVFRRRSLPILQSEIE